MRTFKVTFFDGYEIASVETFHNVVNQGAFSTMLANRVVCQNLNPFVKCEDSDTGEDFTAACVGSMTYEIKDIDPNYTKEYLSNKLGLIL